MLFQRLILLIFFVLFVGTIGEKSFREFKDDDDDDDGEKGFLAQKQSQSFSGNQPVMNNNNNNNVPVQAPNQPAEPRRSAASPLATRDECKADVQRFCSKGVDKPISNLKVLQCIDELDNAINLISKECQHVIYLFKYNMTHDARFDDAAERQCSKDIKLLDECQEHVDERGSGRLVSCLYDRLDNITEASCRFFINQLQAVVFNDWRLSEYFVDACQQDIRAFECGRLDDGNDKVAHEQGAVVSCLSQNFAKIGTKCRKEILRLAEMQSNDYHLDRALYYACREDRDRLCAQVPSGNGRVYRCLYEQKFNNMMSPACRKEVHRRQKVVVADVKSDAPLIRACRMEMVQHNCNVDPIEGEKQSSLVKLLLCLEDSMRKGNHIIDECRREMLIHRKMLMSDYALSPELVSECRTEMVQYCPSLYQQGASGNVEQRGGRIIHCLMGAASRRQKFSSSCLTVLKGLVRAVDPGSDIRSDPLLERTCRPVIEILCPNIQPGDSNVVLCLLDNLKNPKMTESCEDRLMEVAYFIARDWRSVPRLLSVCRENLQTYCQLPQNWSMKDELSDIQVGIYLSCLYQRKREIDGKCRTELKRIMQIRAQSIGLMPEIQESCIEDLATCSNNEKKGEELRCLQDRYNKLQPACRDAVRNYTQLTVEDPTLDVLLMRACEPMIQLFCANIQSGNEDELIRCLIRHKHEQKMELSCRSGIDHHQIITMKDEAFISPQFRSECSKEIVEHCQNKKTKAQVIQCLADLALKDVLKGKNTINTKCRNELRFELLQRSESIDFDPVLSKACRSDVEKLCAGRVRGNAEILDCLKDNREKVSIGCFRVLKRREKIDVVMPENDYSLQSKCASTIQETCSNENKQNLLSCLRRNINHNSMTTICRNVLFSRLMILNSNGRFNKALIENCQADISRYCSDFMIDNDDDDDQDDDELDSDENQQAANEQAIGRDFDDNDLVDRDMGGRLIECLRRKYSDTKVTLEGQCVSELIDVIQMSKIDVRLDVQLYRNCQPFITESCTGIDPEDCLKVRYQKGEIRESNCVEQIKRIIREGQADIHVDRALTFSCQADILKYCNDIPIGSGKQLKCLIGMSKSVTSQCRSMLQKRQELWNSVSNIDSVADLAEEIHKSHNSLYLFSVIMLILCVMFMAGCVCRPYVRYSRLQKYK